MAAEPTASRRSYIFSLPDVCFDWRYDRSKPLNHTLFILTFGAIIDPFAIILTYIGHHWTCIVSIRRCCRWRDR